MKYYIVKIGYKSKKDHNKSAINFFLALLLWSFLVYRNYNVIVHERRCAITSREENIRMKKMQFNFGEKSIETPYLNVRQNVMTWDDTMLQLSNVTHISTSSVKMLPEPWIAFGLIIVGICLIIWNVFVAIVIMAISALWIFLWYKENEKRKLQAILTISMNSGQRFYFNFDNKEFLKKVTDVLERIIMEGIVGNQNVVISIKDCTIGGNSKILDNLSIK